VLSGEATNTIFLVFGLIGSGLERTIYRTRGEQPANHYATDAVVLHHEKRKLYNQSLRAYGFFVRTSFYIKIN
jgi:hypothetical protein